MSEASAYLVFRVDGHANRNLTDLTLLNGPGTGKSEAVVGTDTHNPDTTALQYWDSDGGNGWLNYTPGDTVTIMSDGQLFVRTAVTQDDDYEGPHNLRLQVTPRVGVVKTGQGTIVDDGSETTVFNDPDTTPSSGDQDDDRRIAINDVSVSEASTYLVFEVTSPDDTSNARQVTDFALTDGPDSGSSTGKGIAVIGTDTQDPGSTSLQYYDPQALAWKDYVSGADLVIPSGADGTLFMRTAITQDDDYEGPHNFQLTGVSAIDSNRSGSGTGTIVDDGSTGTVFVDNATTSSSGLADDDRPLSVNNVSVSESSPYIVWKVQASAGRNLTSITLENGVTGTAATVGIDTSDATANSLFEVYDGSNWVTYSGSGTLVVPESGVLYVRSKVQQDSVYEGPETLDLTVTPSVGDSASGVGTIYDDGSVDTEFPASGPGASDGEQGAADDDRPLAVNNVSVSEESPYIVFKVTGGAERRLQDLTLSNGPGSGDSEAVIGVDTSDAGTGVALQTYSTTSGWSDYSPQTEISLNSDGLLYVRTAIVNDAPYEGPHVFTLSAEPTTGSAASGQGTIYDDGSERAVFSETDTSTNSSTGFNDDRPISVNDVSVAESSSYIVFKVSGTSGQVLNGLTLADGDALDGNAIIGTDTSNLNASSGLQIYDPALIEWNDYTSGDDTTIPSSGILYVRTGIAQDNSYEGEENFTLTANSKGGQSDVGTGSIFDDGSEDTVFTDPSPEPTTGSKDDDRPLTVNDVSVSEASDYVVFTISGNEGRALSDLALADGTAIVGVDTQNAGTTPIQYWDDSSSSWKDYASGLNVSLQSDGAGGGVLYVRTGLVQDNLFETDPDPETFQLVVTPDGGADPSTGTASIYDDGSVDTVFPDPSREPSSGTADDDSPITVTDVSVSESSRYIIFKVTGTADRPLDPSGFTWLASGSKPLIVANSSGDVGADLKCYNTGSGNWNLSTNTGTNAACNKLHAVEGQSGGELYVRAEVYNDTPYEGPETATLTITPSTGAPASGVGTVYDDGSVTTHYDNDDSYDPSEGTADDDRTFEVTDVSVSELSPYIVFEVHGTGGFTLDSLALSSGSATVGSDTLDAGTTSALQVYDATNGWSDYNGTDDIDLPSDGILYVRTKIYNDNTSPIYEGPESFTLTATALSGGTTAVGTGTIYDDGTEDTVFSATDTQPQQGDADDDRELAVNNVTVSESSTYIVFEVTDNSSRDVTNFSLSDGSGSDAAVVGTDTTNLGTNGVEYNLGDGSGWQDFTATITFPSGGTLYVRTGVTNDDTLEHAEVFTLQVTSDNGDATTSSATGKGTIVDDGTEGQYFGPNDTSPQDGTPDDDRGIAVNSVTVSEASPHIVFEITSPDDTDQARALSSLALSDGDAGDASCSGTCIATTSGAELDTGTSTELEYFDGSAWQLASGGGMSIPAGGTLYVRTSVVQDSSFEGAHKFTLTASPATGAAASGIGTIVDDGSEPAVFAGGSTSPTNGLADDDRALSVSDVCVSENSTYMVWAISGGSDSAGRKLSGIALKAGSVGTAAIIDVDTKDVGSTNDPLRYSENGTVGSWTGYSGVGEVSLDSNGHLYVLGELRDDDDLEGVESLDLTATPLTGSSATGQAYIFDNGQTTTTLCDAIEIFDERSATGTTVDADTIDDDRPLAINDVAVAESSSHIVFAVTAQDGRVITGLALSDGPDTGSSTGEGIATVDTDTSDASTGVALQYYASGAWQTFTSGTTNITVDSSERLYIRTGIAQDTSYEGPHAFSLAVTPQAGSSVSGVGTIYDDGSSQPVFNNDSPTTTGNERDDDRSIAINSVSVSESSPYIVFELTCGSGTCSEDRWVTGISLAGSAEDAEQTATLASDTTAPSSTALQVYDMSTAE